MSHTNPHYETPANVPAVIAPMETAVDAVDADVVEPRGEEQINIIPNRLAKSIADISLHSAAPEIDRSAEDTAEDLWFRALDLIKDDSVSTYVDGVGRATTSRHYSEVTTEDGSQTYYARIVEYKKLSEGITSIKTRRTPYDGLRVVYGIEPDSDYIVTDIPQGVIRFEEENDDIGVFEVFNPHDFQSSVLEKLNLNDAATLEHLKDIIEDIEAKTEAENSEAAIQESKVSAGQILRSRVAKNLYGLIAGAVIGGAVMSPSGDAVETPTPTHSSYSYESGYPDIAPLPTPEPGAPWKDYSSNTDLSDSSIYHYRPTAPTITNVPPSVGYPSHGPDFIPSLEDTYYPPINSPDTYVPPTAAVPPLRKVGEAPVLPPKDSPEDAPRIRIYGDEPNRDYITLDPFYNRQGKRVPEDMPLTPPLP